MFKLFKRKPKLPTPEEFLQSIGAVEVVDGKMRLTKEGERMSEEKMRRREFYSKLYRGE
jgi:hypothetical protein